MHHVADRLTHNGLNITLPGRHDERRLVIACPAAWSTLSVEDCGFIIWEWHPATAGSTDFRQLADIASALLTGQHTTRPHHGDFRDRAELTLKGKVGRELTASGLSVELEIYPDEMVFNAQTGIVITTPGNPDSEVRITDNGCLSWERDYTRDETAQITWEPHGTAHITNPQALAADIAATITQAITVAIPTLAGAQGRAGPPRPAHRRQLEPAMTL